MEDFQLEGDVEFVPVYSSRLKSEFFKKKITIIAKEPRQVINRNFSEKGNK